MTLVLWVQAVSVLLSLLLTEGALVSDALAVWIRALRAGLVIALRTLALRSLTLWSLARSPILLEPRLVLDARDALGASTG